MIRQLWDLLGMEVRHRHYVLVTLPWLRFYNRALRAEIVVLRWLAREE